MADTLSRAPYVHPSQNYHYCVSQTIVYVSLIIRNLSDTDQRPEEIRMHQSEDETFALQILITDILSQYGRYTSIALICSQYSLII